MKQDRHYGRGLVLLAYAVALPLTGVSEMASGTSASTCICIDAGQSILWQTVQSREVSLDWPRDAVKAVLTVKNGNKELFRIESSDRSVRTLECPIVQPTGKRDERILSYSLDWFAAGDVPLPDCMQRAELALPFDAFSGSCLVQTQEKSVYSYYRGALLQIPAQATLSLDAAPVAVAAPGWKWITASSGQIHELALTVDGETVTRNVRFLGPGLLVSVR